VPGEVPVHVDETCPTRGADPGDARVVVAQPSHLLGSQVVALEIAGPVGGVVHVRGEEHGPGETVAHGLQDPVQVPQDALDSRIARTVGGPDE